MNAKRKINNVILTRDTFRKINDYSYIVSSIVGDPVEVMGLLVGDKEDTLSIAKDAYLIWDQAVTKSESFPDSRSLGEAYFDIKAQGDCVVGMWHSHGSHPNFHSTDDNDYLEHLVTFNSFMYPNLRMIEGEQLPFAASVVINQNSYLRPNPLKQTRRHEHYYCCAGLRENDNIEITGSLELILIPSINKIQNDYLELFNEVCEQVNYKGKRLGEMFDESIKEDGKNSIYSSIKRIFSNILT